MKLTCVKQTTDYYPFGMVMNQSPHTGTGPENKFLYNGKELQDDVIANIKLDWYDYGARMYDAAIGRWHVVDPLADFFPSQSPYVYAANNPVRYIDYMGLSAEEPYPVDPDGTMVLPVVTITATRVEPKKNFLERSLGWLFAPFRNYEHKQRFGQPITSIYADGSSTVANKADIVGPEINIDFLSPSSGRSKRWKALAESLKRVHDVVKITKQHIAESESMEKIEREIDRENQEEQEINIASLRDLRNDSIADITFQWNDFNRDDTLYRKWKRYRNGTDSFMTREEFYSLPKRGWTKKGASPYRYIKVND